MPNAPRYSLAAVVLAAGASTRMNGEIKPLRKFRGTPQIVRILSQLRRAGAARLVVVSGRYHEEFLSVLDPLDVTVIRNEAWEDGMASSIACGIRSLNTTVGIEGALLVPCDLPLAEEEDFSALFAAFRGSGDCVAVRQSDGLSPGAPALFGRDFFPRLLTLEGRKGARSLLKQIDTRTLDLPRLLTDADTPEEWARLEQDERHPQRS